MSIVNELPQHEDHVKISHDEDSESDGLAELDSCNSDNTNLLLKRANSMSKLGAHETLMNGNTSDLGSSILSPQSQTSGSNNYSQHYSPFDIGLLDSEPFYGLTNQSYYNHNRMNGNNMTSMSASNSAYNLGSSRSPSSTHANDGSPSHQTNNSSMYDDDDVFSSNSNNVSFSNPPPPQQSSTTNTPAANTQEAFTQLYRTLLRSNISPASLNELLMHHSLNNLSLNSNGNGNEGYSPMASSAAMFKQQQHHKIGGNRMHNTSLQSSPMSSNSSNIAALTSATNNMASMLSSSGSSQPPPQQFLHNPKRRINSIATATPTFSPQPQLFPAASTHNAGPNATMLLQNSSLASSARLNMSSSSTASVLGSNSTLTHTLNALQQQNAFGAQSPNGSSSHNLLSALSLQTASSAANAAKPLRSERLPAHMVEEIIKQGKIRRKQGGKKEVCVFCRNNSEKEQFYTSHTLKDAANNVACPILRLYQCPICHASGDQAHTIKYCPYAEKDSAYIKLFKDSGKIAAAALFMNSLTNGMGSLNGGPNTPPSSASPPDTPSPIAPQQSLLGQGNHQMNFLNSHHQPQISSPSSNSAHLSLVQALNNLQNANRSFGGVSSAASPNTNLLLANFLNSNNANLNKSN